MRNIRDLLQHLEDTDSSEPEITELDSVQHSEVNPEYEPDLDVEAIVKKVRDAKQRRQEQEVDLDEVNRSLFGEEIPDAKEPSSPLPYRVHIPFQPLQNFKRYIEYRRQVKAFNQNFESNRGEKTSKVGRFLIGQAVAYKTDLRLVLKDTFQTVKLVLEAQQITGLNLKDTHTDTKENIDDEISRVQSLPRRPIDNPTNPTKQRLNLTDEYTRDTVDRFSRIPLKEIQALREEADRDAQSGISDDNYRFLEELREIVRAETYEDLDQPQSELDFAIEAEQEEVSVGVQFVSDLEDALQATNEPETDLEDDISVIVGDNLQEESEPEAEITPEVVEKEVKLFDYEVEDPEIARDIRSKSTAFAKPVLLGQAITDVKPPKVEVTTTKSTTVNIVIHRGENIYTELAALGYPYEEAKPIVEKYARDNKKELYELLQASVGEMFTLKVD